jgi:hypothetical protein
MPLKDHTDKRRDLCGMEYYNIIIMAAYSVSILYRHKTSVCFIIGKRNPSLLS